MVQHIGCNQCSVVAFFISKVAKTQRGRGSSRVVAAKYFILFGFFVSSFFLFLCFFFLSVTSSSFLLISLPRRCSITIDSLGDGVFFYIYFTHRSGQSHCDLDMSAQRRNPGRRTRMLRSIAVVRWTALELEVERTFEARTVRFFCHSGQE